jgi:hypothetical protein
LALNKTALLVLPASPEPIHQHEFIVPFGVSPVELPKHKGNPRNLSLSQGAVVVVAVVVVVTVTVVVVTVLVVVVVV